MTSEEQTTRLGQLADAAEAAVLADPALLGSMVGMALGYMIEGARRDPASAIADLESYGRAVAEAVGYVLDGTRPGPGLRRLLPGVVTET